MISYYDGQLTDIMPGNITKKPEVKALSYALQQACRLLYRYSRRLYIYTNLDEQPEEVIDLLASELRTQYYRSTLDLDTKRRLVKNTLIWYMSAGTPQAVEELVGVVFGEGEVKEWYEYADKPYYFKIATNAILTPEMNDFFSIMIRRVKNTRSHLRAIDIHRTIEQELFAGVGQFPNYRPPAVIDGYSVDRRTEQTIHAGAATRQENHPAAIVDGFSFEGKQVIGEAYIGGAVTATEHQAAIIEGLEEHAESIEAQAYAGAAAGPGAPQKPAAVREGLSTQGQTVRGTISAGAAAGSKYKNIVRE